MERHEDMPKAAFKDLLKTVQKSKTWKGILEIFVKMGIIIGLIHAKDEINIWDMKSHKLNYEGDERRKDFK